MATCGLHVWGGPEKPGYWVYCLRDGRVAGRIYRRHEKGYRIAPLPARNHPRRIYPPFAELDNVEKKILVGAGDRKFLVSAKAGTPFLSRTSVAHQ